MAKVKKIGYSKDRFTIIKKITADAKKLRNKNLQLSWQDAIKQAGAAYRKGPVKKKIAGVKPAAKKTVKKKVAVKKAVIKKIAKKKSLKSPKIEVIQVGSLHKKHHQSLRTQCEIALRSFEARLEGQKKFLKDAKTLQEKRAAKKVIDGLKASIALMKLHIREHNKELLK